MRKRWAFASHFGELVIRIGTLVRHIGRDPLAPVLNGLAPVNCCHLFMELRG
jgi:hypothetical protein